VYAGDLTVTIERTAPFPRVRLAGGQF